MKILPRFRYGSDRHPRRAAPVKTYSLARRLVLTVLAVQILLTGCITVVALVYERQQDLRTFDVMLRGRADSLLGAVRDAEDEADNVKLDTAALDLPPGDMFEVEEPSGHILARSANWPASGAPLAARPERGISFRSGGKWYRGIAVHGVRQVDQSNDKPGIARPVIVRYAASLHPVGVALRRAAQFLVLSNGIVLLLTAALLLLLLRRGLAPVSGLAREAAAISGASLRFTPPPEALAVRELSAFATALATAMERVERSVEQQRAFVHDAAHEMKTAMTIVKSSLQRLGYRPRTVEEYQQGLELCLNDTERMEELVGKMLTLARLEQVSRHEVQEQLERSTSTSEAVLESLSHIESMAALRRVALETDLDSLAFVSVPHEELGTLLINLLVNAVQHSFEGGVIEVGVRRQDAQVVLSVRDHGEGIEPHDLPFVFDRFYRGDRSRSRDTGGTGLGLAICKAIVDAYGGRIQVESERGKGTSFLVLLPAAAQPAGSPGVQHIFMGSH